MNPKNTSLEKLLEIFDQLDDEAQEDVLNHARLMAKKQNALPPTQGEGLVQEN